MKKRLLASLAIGVLLAAMLPAVVSASITEGRPGQYELRQIEIDGVNGRCAARYAVTVNGNTFISDANSTDTDITWKENKNFVHVTCRFTDTSGVYEANAEVGYTDNCRARVELGGGLTGGTGRAVAAANNAADGSNGGNVTLKCTFDK